MATEVLKTCDNLQDELDKARNNLKGLNDNIRRIIGRDPPDTNSNSRNDRKRNYDRRNDFGVSTADRVRLSSPPPSKRRQGGGNDNNPKSVFSRLSGPPLRERDNDKPKILSRVIRELPTRQEVVAAQGGIDAESRARNRRMFGCLIGTLQKFCQEESRLKPKEEKKAQIEKKLEEQQKKERENLKKERQNLFTDRKRQQQDIKILEFKMNRMKELKAWEESKAPLKNFIRTKSRPHIYYCPKIMDKKNQQKLEDSQINLQKMIEKKRKEVSDELGKMEYRYRIPQTELNYNNHKINETINKNNNRHNNNDDGNDGIEDDDDDDDSSYSDDDNNHQQQQQQPSLIDVIKIEPDDNNQNLKIRSEIAFKTEKESAAATATSTTPTTNAEPATPNAEPETTNTAGPDDDADDNDDTTKTNNESI